MSIDMYLIISIALFVIVLSVTYVYSKNKSSSGAQNIQAFSYDFEAVNSILAEGKRILILAPHQDDEALMCAGVISHALRNGVEVKIGVITNGDKKGRKIGLTRIKETIKAMDCLGLDGKNITFFGYGSTEMNVKTSFMYRLYHADTDSTVIASNVGSETYSIPDSPEYHYQKFGSPGAYNRSSLREDLKLFIAEYKPDHIFTASLYDIHPDHFILYQFIIEAIIATKRTTPAYSPILHEYIIHSHDGDDFWPLRNQKNNTPAPFSKPATFDTDTLLDWEKREIFTVPIEMQSIPYSKNKKHVVISKYRSQRPSGNKNYLYSYVKRDEIFWKKDFSNIALLASVRVSSENLATDQLGCKVIDGISEGYPRFPKNEWASLGETAGAWIQLNWSQAHNVNKIVLYDRPNLKDNIISATLSFSDGTWIDTGPLPNNGSSYEILFAPKSINWVKLTVTKATGENVGLSEFEVYQTPENSNLSSNSLQGEPLCK
ncbi:DUF7402 domain-containing protein [Anaerospora hongkongensis]|uniref:DUF7402 domain-containing protein n=1 Tax=Anaerospora hongkongensis TaxID=244830 RepID=UPI0028A02111|nr:PIG-L family deacetylase [Anaerospora hongkongensis]